MSRLRIFLLPVLLLGLLACSTPETRYVKRGHKYLGSGKLEKAEGEFRKAIEEDPANPKAHFGLGYALFRQNELDEAMAAYRQGIDIDPDDPDSHYYLGLIYNEKNMQKEAREEFKVYDKLKRFLRR
jgi:Tfp pilus assembly protein PilF